MQLEVANGLNGMRPGTGTARGMARGMAQHDTCSYSTTRHEHVLVEHVERHGTHVGWAHFFSFFSQNDATRGGHSSRHVTDTAWAQLEAQHKARHGHSTGTTQGTA